MTDSPAWARACLALALLAVNPKGLRGLTVRARVGPVRRVLEQMLARLPGPERRIHPDLSDVALFGGADIAATLGAGRLVRSQGLADTPARLVLPMAERTRAGLAARLAQLLDVSPGHTLVLLDEGLGPEERAPAALQERLALHVELDDVPCRAARPSLAAPADLAAARDRLPAVTHSAGDLVTLSVLAVQFGIDSLRAPWLALCAARAHAALEGRDSVRDADIRAASELVYPARATQFPAEEEPEDSAPPEPPEQGGSDADKEETPTPDHLPDELLIDAVAAMLPPNLLDQLVMRARAQTAARGSGAGVRRRALLRGRPLPARPGRPDGRARIDLIATLRAAAPWQPMRRAARDQDAGVIIHPDDIHLKRYEDRADRLLIFAVDASGSAALARLAEAKGAVELLLGEAYARRDRVALIAFRGTGAEVLLPPTRSLVQAKRRLAGLPGGGGTPLAAALQAVMALADQARGQGLSPSVALLTDGRANITLDGRGDRAQAARDSRHMARMLRRTALPGMVIDVAGRPGPAPTDLATEMGARHLPLPRADARRISSAVTAALDG